MKTIKTINLIPLNEEKTQICLVKRTPDKNKKIKWSFPGESIKTTENDKQAMVRIIKDQMNCEAFNFKEFTKSNTTTKMAVIKSHYLTGSIKGEVKLDQRKYTECKWFDLDENLLKLDYAFNEKMIVEKVLSFFKI